MKKRLWGILMTLVMVIGLLPATAFAEETFTKVSTADAFKTAVGKGESVKLTDNITFSESVDVSTTLTIYLNGQTLTTEKDYGVKVTDGTVTFKDSGENGTFEGNGNNFRYLVYNEPSGNVVFESGIYDYSAAWSAVMNYGAVEIKGGTFQYGSYATAAVEQQGGFLTISGNPVLEKVTDKNNLGLVVYYKGGSLDVSEYAGESYLRFDFNTEASADPATGYGWFDGGTLLNNSGLYSQVILSKICTVTFNPGEGTGTEFSAKVPAGFAWDEEEIVDFEAPEGKAFDYWQGSDGKEYDSPITVYEDVTLTAIWEEVSEDEGEGTYKYDPDGDGYMFISADYKTLILNNYDSTGIYIPISIIENLVLKGENSIDSESYGFATDGNLTISGDGSLEIQSDMIGIFVGGNLTISSGEINIATGMMGIMSGGKVTIEGEKTSIAIEVENTASFGEDLEDDSPLKSLVGKYAAIYGAKGVDVAQALTVTKEGKSPDDFHENDYYICAPEVTIENEDDGNSDSDFSVYVGGVGMVAGYYLDNDGEICDEEPDDGCAYLEKEDDGTLTLTLNNYVYEGAGYQYDDEEGYSAAIYTTENLNLVLKGTNKLCNTAEVFSDGITSEKNVTISGDGSLTIKAVYGIYANDVTIKGRKVTIENAETGIYADGNVAIQDAEVTIEAEEMGIYAKKVSIAGWKTHLSVLIDSTLDNKYKAIYGAAGVSVDRALTVTKEGKSPDDFYEDDYYICAPEVTIEKEDLVYVGGVRMYEGDYLAVGANATTTEKSDGGYAYLNKENGNLTLTLHAYTYAGEGYEIDKSFSSIYAEQDLDIVLVGDNNITNEPASDEVLYSTGIEVRGDLTISSNGNGTLTAVADEADTLNSTGIRATGDLTVKDCTVTAKAGEAGYISYGIDTYGGLKIENSKVTAITDKGTFSYGIYTLEDLEIKDSTVTATADESKQSIGIFVPGLFTIKDTEKVTVVEANGKKAAFATGDGILQEGTAIIEPENYAAGSIGINEEDFYTTVGIEDDEGNFTPAESVRIQWATEKNSGSGGGGSSTSVKADDDTVTIDTSSSSVSETNMDKAIDKAADNDADEIVIDTNKSKVTLPEDTAEKIADKTDADLVIETKNGTVTIPNSTLEDMDAEGKVTVEVTKDKVSISDENGELTDIGKIEVTVPYKENSETGNVAVEVTKADGTKEVIEDVYDGKGSVTFEIDGSVTFEIIDDYVPMADVPVQPVENPFKDVSEADWFYKAVMYVSENGLMSGVDTDNFGPYHNTTRGMITTILWRMEGKPEAGIAPFIDVKADMYYAEAIAWAAENGIVSGYGLEFGPDDNITREQLASILYRYAKFNGEGFEGLWAFRLDFSDVAELSDYAYEPMCWCVMNGIISGNDDGTLNPKGYAQRSHAAQMLMKFDENVK